MAEIKYDVRRGADTYRLIYFARLKSWILKGIIKRDEALVWRSGLSGWRKPEELEELKPYFEQREAEYLKREKAVERPVVFPKKRIKNILIIDDEEDLCWLLSNALTGKGYAVSTANTIGDGMAHLNEIPDLILLDLKLPDGDGMDVLPEIKRITPETIVVIISAYGSEERRQDANNKGVHGFIDKPLTEENILSTIKQFQKEDAVSDQ